MTYFYAQSQQMQALLVQTSVLSLGAAILSLIMGFCIPFFLATFYAPVPYSPASIAPSNDQSSAPSSAPSKIETGVPIGLWMTYLAGRP